MGCANQKSIEQVEEDTNLHDPRYAWSERVKLGGGSYGEVFKVLNKTTNEMVAIKRMSLSKFKSEEQFNTLEAEISAMKDLKSPYTVMLFDVIRTSKFIYLIVELCEKDLTAELIAHGGRMTEAKCRQVYCQVTESFKVLHGKNYIHRDVKPDNILIKGTYYKIADFGFAKKLKRIDKERLTEICGTPIYMAPQLLFDEDYTSKCDIWSLGLMFYELFFGFAPWPYRSLVVYRESILSRPVSFPYKCKIGVNTQDLLKRCLTVSDSKRISWSELFEHSFFLLGPGEDFKFRQITEPAAKTLLRIQETSLRKRLNILEKFKLANIQTFKDKQEFSSFLNTLDSNVTSNEVQIVFDALKDSKNQVKFSTFKEVFCDVDYRSEKDVTSRLVNDLIAMAQSKNVQLKEFFRMFDADSSGAIDFKEFQSLLRKIAPQLRTYQIKIMWNSFELNSSQQLDYRAFEREMTRGLSTTSRETAKQKAQRSVQCLREHLVYNKIKPEDVLQKADSDKTGALSTKEFATMVQEINYSITLEEINQMFLLVDADKDNKVSQKQIINLLKG